MNISYVVFVNGVGWMHSDRKIEDLAQVMWKSLALVMYAQRLYCTGLLWIIPANPG